MDFGADGIAKASKDPLGAELAKAASAFR